MAYGFGLIKGMYVTAKRFFKKKVTEMYPEVLPDLPARSRGSFDFSADSCIACNICAEVCPNGVIRVDSFKNDKGKKVLENYRMNLGYCMFCGACVEACPRKAICFRKDFNLACYDRGDAIMNFKGNVYKDAADAKPANDNKPVSDTRPADETRPADDSQKGQGVQ